MLIPENKAQKKIAAKSAKSLFFLYWQYRDQYSLSLLLLMPMRYNLHNKYQRMVSMANADEKQKIRQRYKGIALDEIEKIPAIEEKDIFDDDSYKRVGV